MLETKFSVELDLREPQPSSDAQIVFRCRKSDRTVINNAARVLGISTNRLMRTVMVQTAQQVLRQNTKKAEPKIPEVRFAVSGGLPPGMKGE